MKGVFVPGDPRYVSPLTLATRFVDEWAAKLAGTVPALAGPAELLPSAINGAAIPEVLDCEVSPHGSTSSLLSDPLRLVNSAGLGFSSLVSMTTSLKHRARTQGRSNWPSCLQSWRS